MGIFYAPPSNTPSGIYTETLTISGTTVLDSTAGQSNVNGGATISMGATSSAQNDGVTLNSSVTIDSGAVIGSHARYGGAVFLRSEGSGNLYIDNSGTVTALGVHDDNTALTNDEVNAGYSVDGLTATSHVGSVTVINQGTVTAYSGRGLYGDGNYGAVILDGCCTVIGFTSAPEQTVSLTNTATGTVDAYLAGMRAIDYYGLATIANAGTVHSTARQALVAWSAWGDASVTNSGTATADDRNAIVAATEVGNATIVNSGTVTASKLAVGTLGAGAGYSGLRAIVDTTGDANVTNSGTVTANFDAAIVAHTPTGNATVTNSGTLTGLNGVFIDNGSGLGAIDTLTDTNATTNASITGIAKFVNSGIVTAVNYGAYLDGTTNLLTNTGTITASSGIGVVTGNGGTGTIINSGTISGLTYGLDLGAAATITNRGLISGDAAAVRFAVGGNTLNIYDSAVFTGGVDFSSTTGNTSNFYTGSYTLAVSNYTIAGNTVNALGSAQIVAYTHAPGNGAVTAIVLADVSSITRSISLPATYAASLHDMLDSVISSDACGSAQPSSLASSCAATSTLNYTSAPGETPAIKAANALGNPNPRQPVEVDNSLWSRTFGGLKYQPGTDGDPSASISNYGAAIGLDHRFGSNRFGFMAGFGGIATDNRDGSGSVTGHTGFAGLYGRFDIGSGVNLYATLTGGVMSNRSIRDINGGQEKAVGTYDSYFVTPELAVAKSYDLGGPFTFTPKATLRYTAATFDGFTETGSSQNIAYAAASAQSVEGKLEGTFGFRQLLANGLFARYELTAGISDNQAIGPRGVVATLSGSDFTVDSPDKANVAGLSLGAAVNVPLSSVFELSLAVSGKENTDRSASANGYVGMRYAF